MDEQEGKPKYFHPAGLRYLVNNFGDGKPLIPLFANYADDELLDEFNGFLNTSPKTLLSAIATMRSALEVFGTKEMARITSYDTIAFEELRKKKIALFVTLQEDSTHKGVILNIFFRQLFAAFRNPTNGDRKVAVILEEGGNFKIDQLQVQFATMRRRDVAIAYICQSVRQIAHLYGQNVMEAILDSVGTVVQFGGCDISRAEPLSKSFGSHGVIVKDPSNGSKRIVSRPLLEPNDIIQLDPKKALLMMGSKPPALLCMRPFYKRRKLRKRTQIPPVKDIVAPRKVKIYRPNLTQ